MSSKIKQCPGGSVGVVFEKDGKYLLFQRLKEPYGWAGVAGHLDNDAPLFAGVREAREEVGVNIGAVELLFGNSIIYPNSCSRGDYNAHEWHVYKALKWEGEPHICEPDKHKNLDWFSSQEVKEKFTNEPCDPAWKYIFSKLGTL